MRKLQLNSLTTLLTLSFLSYSTTALSSFHLSDDDDVPTVLDEPQPRQRAALQSSFHLSEDEEVSQPAKGKRAQRPKTDTTTKLTESSKKRGKVSFQLDDEPPQRAELQASFHLSEDEDDQPPVSANMRAEPPKDTDKTTPLKKRGKVAAQPVEEEEEDELDLQEERLELEQARDTSNLKKRNSIPRKAKDWYEPGKYAALNQIPLAEGDNALMDYMDNVEEMVAAEGGIEFDDDARDLLMKVFREDLKDGRKYQKAKVAKMLKEMKADGEIEEDAFNSEEEFLEALQEQEDRENGTHLGEWKAKIEPIKKYPEAYKEALSLAEDLAVEDVSNEGVAVKKKRLQLMTELPWGKVDAAEIDLEKARAILDEDHYGLEKIKKRILEYLAVKQRNPNHKGTILCFVGPPGVGKTTLAESIARATGRKFVSAALGGVDNEAAIRGSLPVYISSSVGKPLKALKKVGVDNPVMLLDEIDKIHKDGGHGSPADALLEVLDPSQNTHFEDHFIGVPYDLSQVMFICSANTLETIPGPLRDRLEIIELSSYTHIEKMVIAQKHLIPKAVKEHGLRPKELHIRSATLKRIIEEYTHEAGVRNLAREISALCRKVVMKNGMSDPKQIIMEPGMLEEYLGPRKEIREQPLEKDTVGHVQGLAYMTTGGAMLPLEAVLTPGKGEVAKTGSLGKNIKESVQYAWTLVKTLLPEFGMTVKDLADKDIHLHMYDAATPKDGPSAGAAITTAMISAITNIPVRRTVCMTGEVNLQGKILPIGGVKEKLIAAHRAGMDVALIPKDNVPELVDVPAEVVRELKIMPMNHIRDVLKIALNRDVVKGK